MMDVIHTYTRKQAIEDGVLVALDELNLPLVQAAGFTCPVAMTSQAFFDAIAREGEELTDGQSIDGRMWDVLRTLRYAVACSRDHDETTDVVRFKVLVWRDGKHETVRLWCKAHGDDDGNLVLTIMLEGED